MDEQCIKCKGAKAIDDLFDAITTYIFDCPPDYPCDVCPRCKGTGKEPEPDSYEARTYY